MKKKIILLNFNCIILLLNFTYSYGQAPINWSNYEPKQRSGMPSNGVDINKHRANDALFLINGNVISCGVSYPHKTLSSYYMHINKYDNAGVVISSYQFTATVGKLTQVASCKDNVYALGRVGTGNFINAGFLLKFNSNLNVLWSKYWGAPTTFFPEVLNRLALDTAGNPYVAYISKSNTPGKIIKVEKYDGKSSHPKRLWKIALRDLDSLKIATISDLKVDLAGNAYICATVTHPALQSKYLVAKINSDGTTGWKRYYDGYDGNGATGDDVPAALAIDYNQDIIVTGKSYRDANGFDCLTIKYNPQGDIIWKKRKDFDGIDNGGQFIQVDSSNNVYVAGYNGADNSALIKYDDNGNTVWQRRFANFVVNAMKASSQGTVYLGGSKIFYGSTISSAGMAHLKKILPGGNLEWSYSDHKSLDVPNGLNAENDYTSGYDAVSINENTEEVFAAGYSKLGYYINQGSGDYVEKVKWLADNFSPTARYESVTDENFNTDVNLFPNPAEKELVIQFKDDIESAGLSLLDLQGRIVMNKELNGNGQIINVGELTPGVYIARIIFDGQVINKKFVKE